jgi:hypothetical protein
LEVRLEYIDKASYIDGSVTQRGISTTALVMLLRIMLCRTCQMYQCCVVLKDAQIIATTARKLVINTPKLT